MENEKRGQTGIVSALLVILGSLIFVSAVVINSTDSSFVISFNDSLNITFVALRNNEIISPTTENGILSANETEVNEAVMENITSESQTMENLTLTDESITVNETIDLTIPVENMSLINQNVNLTLPIDNETSINISLPEEPIKNLSELTINDIVAADKFNQLKGFKQIGFTIDYDNIAVESFGKESISSSEKKLKNRFISYSIEVETIYEEIDTSFFNVDEKPVKQTYILKNLLDTIKNVKLNILYEIDSDFIFWKSTKYTISNEPIYFKAFKESIEIFPGLNETSLTGHTLTFGNNYYDFKDVTDLDYSVSVYSLDGKNYINLEILQEIDGLGEFIIDPIIGWTSRIITTAAHDANSVFAIDIDNDGNIDVLSTSYDIISGSNDKVAWYENNGSSPPGWTNYTIATSANKPESVYAIDIDNDNDIDVLSASISDDKIAWYENDGSSPPNWAAHNISTSADHAYAVYAIDMDKDNDIDVLSASIQDSKIAWYENNGSSPPSWTTHIISSSANFPTSVFAIDLDNDTDIDVLTTLGIGDKVVWYENNGSSPPSWTTYTITTIDAPQSLYAIDLDNDSDIDVVSGSTTDNKIEWYENDGNSTPNWTTHIISNSVMKPVSFYAIDIDDDNDIDVVSALSNNNSITWHENNGSSPPNWTTHTISTSVDGPMSVYAIDIDHDSDIDVVSASYQDNKITWHESNSTPANTTDLEILEIIPIQVIRDVDMVLGKTGLVRVNVKNNGPLDVNGTVTVTFEGQSLSSYGNDTNRKFITNGDEVSFDFSFTPESTGTQTFSAEVTVG